MDRGEEEIPLLIVASEEENSALLLFTVLLHVTQLLTRRLVPRRHWAYLLVRLAAEEIATCHQTVRRYFMNISKQGLRDRHS